MKKNVVFESLKFSQIKAINRNLKLSHWLLSDYLYQFFTSGNTIETAEDKQETYYSFTYNKILSDLPILGIKKRRLQELFSDLEAAKIIKRLKSPIHSPKIYIRLVLSHIQV